MKSRARAKTKILSVADDFKKEVWKQLGDIDYVEITNDLVLVAIYIRPEKTPGGIILPEPVQDEDRYQGKVGMVIKLGPTAFKYDNGYLYEGPKPQIGDYVFFRTSDSHETFLRGVPCRFLDSYLVKGIIPDPEIIW